MFPQQPAAHPETQPHPAQQPEPHAYEVAQPVPAATDIAGHDAADSWPPVTVPADVPPPPPPPRGRPAFLILVTAAVLLAAAIAVTATLGWSDVSQLRQDKSDRRAELAAMAQQEEAAARRQLDDFRGAGLESKLQRVKDLDKAADVAFRDWRNGGVRFGVLEAAMNTCNDAVITYNSAAGPFPDHLLTTLPRQIDLKNPDTDCGRAFTAGI
jgi:hypothetical protein